MRAGLALVDAVANLQTDFDTALKARIGIATGTVVVGDIIGKGPAMEQTVVGETPNLAARLQTLAEPGTVLICPSTRELIGGHFDYRDLGALALRLGGAGTSLAGGGDELRGKQLRGDAQEPSAAAVRA